MSFWHRMKVRLGLEDEWDDEYYDDEEEEYYDAEPAQAEDVYTPRRAGGDSPYGSGASAGAVRRLDRGPDLDRARAGGSLRSVPTGASSVTPVGAQMKMHIVEPKSFTEAQAIADKFKQGTPVIMNMAMTSPDLAKRLLDFASGLTYGLDGGLQKVSDKVFMLTPHNVDVSDADRRRLRDTGLYSGE
ncbi:MAG: cell division protein SepF [Coriobacteriia bacterium]|nr:cell division protein SepF [Coriobacteriia bacterium]